MYTHINAHAEQNVTMTFKVKVIVVMHLNLPKYWSQSIDFVMYTHIMDHVDVTLAFKVYGGSMVKVKGKMH